MNLALDTTVISSVVTLFVALLAWTLSNAPGFPDQRWFARAALAATAFLVLNLPANHFGSDHVALVATTLQISAAALQVVCWWRYAAASLGPSGAALERWAERGLLLLAALAAVPGVVYSGVHARVSEPLAIVTRDPVPTTVGQVVIAAVLCAFLWPLGRYLAGWRRGVPFAGVHSLALVFLLAMAVNDALAVQGLLHGPYLLDLGFVGPIVAVGWVIIRRLSQDAWALDALRGRLEQLVQARTAELARAHEALRRSERLATIGQFARGVAHEVNSPAAALKSNLAYLDESLPPDAPQEVRESLRDSQRSVARVISVVGQLREASGYAGAGPGEPVPCARVVEAAVRDVGPRCPPEVRLEVDVPADLTVRGHEGMILRVLVNLIANGVEAVPAGRAGVVRVVGRRAGAQIELAVTDDGVGMPPEVLGRVFEPFYSTKPTGTAAGLGLAVSRGLVTGLGGDLRLESSPGAGTRATLALPAAGTEPGTA